MGEHIYAKSKKRKSRSIYIGAGLLMVFAAGLAFLFATSKSDVGKATASLAELFMPSDQVKGSTEASITIVEYSDFQCPACAAYYPIVKQLTSEYGDRVKFVYRHFPLSQIHANAERAAHAAEAAGIQGKFWEMHDMLFENQKVWAESSNPDELFIGYAVSLGIDQGVFEKALDSKEVKEKVTKDYLSGMRARINGTPTFFLNSKQIQNPRNYDEFKALIEALSGA